MSRIIVNKYGKIITDAVNDKKRLRDLITYIERYFDKNSEVMFSQGPTNALIFTNKDKEVIYEFLQVNPKEVKDVIKQVETIKASWQLLNDPFIILCVFIIRELEIKKMNRERDLVLMYLSMKSYSSKQRLYFKYGANEQIMSYTINNLSDKFKYKALKNNFAVVKDIVMQSHSVYVKLLVKGDDDMLNIYFAQGYNRINKVIKKIANEYYLNRDKKKYLNTLITFDGEKGGTLDYESSSSIIDSLAESTTTFFVSSSVNSKLVRNTATANKLPYISVYQTLLEIRKHESPQSLVKLFSAILETIYTTDKSILARICSKDFAVIALKQLSISNSNSEPLKHVKAELDRMLNEYCSKYAMTDRLATRMAYRNTIYKYLIYILISNKCR